MGGDRIRRIQGKIKHNFGLLRDFSVGFGSCARGGESNQEGSSLKSPVTLRVAAALREYYSSYRTERSSSYSFRLNVIYTCVSTFCVLGHEVCHVSALPLSSKLKTA